MALAINVTNGRMLASLVTVEEELGGAVFVIHFIAKPFNQLYITNKTECFSFKSGHAVHVARLTKTDWLTMLNANF